MGARHRENREQHISSRQMILVIEADRLSKVFRPAKKQFRSYVLRNKGKYPHLLNQHRYTKTGGRKSPMSTVFFDRTMSDKIKQYWNERARHMGGSTQATTDDLFLRELEIAKLKEK